MSTTNACRLVVEQVRAGSARGSARARLHGWSLRCVLAGAIMLSTVALASTAAAGMATTNPTSRGDDGPGNTPGVGAPAVKSGYRPRVLGSALQRRAHLGTRQARSVGEQVECPACDAVGYLATTKFPSSTRINNEWYPFVPGTQRIFEGQSNRGEGLLDHQVIITATDLVKDIGGVPCMVVWEVDINEGVLSESELAFVAQDEDGNVWLVGEYPEEYEQGQFSGAENTWIHGVEWAEAGVTIRSNPILGTPGYQQARAPENDFWDCGIVHATNRELTCALNHCYKDVVTIREWAPLDGCDVQQLKTYAKNFGVIKVGAIDDPEGETLLLNEFNHLNGPQMDAVRAACVALDAHGYEVNEHYVGTSPIHRALNWPHPDGNGARHAESQAPQADGVLSVTPNPVQTSTGIAYGIAKPGRVDLGIFDVTGRKIRSLVSETAAPGSYRVQWDGRDDGGRSVAGGVYFARLRTESQLVQRTFVVAK